MSKQENGLVENTAATEVMTTVDLQPKVPDQGSQGSDGEHGQGNGWKWFGRCWLVLGLVLCLVLFLKAMPRSPRQVKPSETAEPAAVVASLSPATPQTVKPLEPVKRRVLKTRPIETIRVCQRVLGRNPKREEVEESEEPDPKTWKMLEIEMTKPSRKMLQATMVLSPVQFDEEYDAQTGTIELDRPEMGAEGTARVLRISPCPAVEPGPGQVVTATFKHEPDGELLTVSVAGEEIGCTANHPFWSEDRQEFVEASALREGERVLTRLEGISAVTKIIPRPPTEWVYNFEVQGEHVYEISRLGLLVHNTYTNKIAADVAAVARKTGFRLEQRGGKWVTISINSRGQEVVRSATGRYDFVTINRKIRVLRPGSISSHTALAGDGPVDYAGQILFSGRSNRGRIRYWDNGSGHFRPFSADAAKAGLPMDLFRPLPGT